MRTLAQCLIDAEPHRLRAIARHWGMEELPKRRQAAVSTLAERMLEPGNLERVWDLLSPDEQAALTALREAEEGIAWPTFTRRWGEVRSMGPGRMARERPWESPASPAEALWYRGVLFRTFAEGPTGLREVALLPEEVRARLPMTASPPSLRLEPTEPPPLRRLADDFLLDDGCTLLAYLQNHSLRPDPESGWPSRAEASLLRRMREPDPGRLAFLRHLAHRLGWLRTLSSGHLRPDPGPAAAWLQSTPAEQRSALAQAWREDPTWNDLWHVPSLHAEDTGSWRNDPLLARRRILGYLSTCDVGAWYGVDAFAAAIKAADPDFQRPDGDYCAWYIRDAATDEYLSGFETWERVEGTLIRYLITGPLFWLGMVDLGGTEEAGLLEGRGFDAATRFRLSPAGGSLLGSREEGPEEAEEAPPLVVRPDLTVLAPAVRRYERFQISRVADWVRTADPYVYRLTPASLERALEQRISVERIVSFLREVTEDNLPPALEIGLERWSNRGTEVRLERGILLRVEEERLMEELTTNLATRRLIREIISPTAALVAPGDWPRLARRLVERGVLPDVIRLEGEDAG